MEALEEGEKRGDGTLQGGAPHFARPQSKTPPQWPWIHVAFTRRPHCVGSKALLGCEKRQPRHPKGAGTAPPLGRRG